MLIKICPFVLNEGPSSNDHVVGTLEHICMKIYQ
jgi:hypothetical protein